MADLLKNMYNFDSLLKLAEDIHAVYEPFVIEDFLKSTMDKTWNDLELKGRINHITVNLRKYLPQDYKTAIGIIDKVAANYGSWLTGFGFFFPTFVEKYGLDEMYWDISMGALERYTAYSSAEFAVRPFIIRYEERMMAQMYSWSKHESEHVRRLSCEGCRPALPWAQALPKFKKDPSPILPILERLKDDPCEFVRRSVANNLNDISKTRPDLVCIIAKDWYGKTEHVNWVVKHGCRTLLKKANRDILSLFGYDNAVSVAVSDFALVAKSVAFSGDIGFTFAITAKDSAKVRLEYAIDYVKSNGKRSRKIFKISEISLKADEKKSYSKTHSFADVSTRKHYPGVHSVTLIVNGQERVSLDFELLEPLCVSRE